MARPSLQDVQSLANTNFADNTIGAITPQKLREWCAAIIAALAPAYGLLSRTSAAQPLNLTTTPQLVTYQNGYVSDIEDYTAEPTGQLTRLEHGTTVINFTADLTASGNQSRQITFALWRNDVETTWRQTIYTTANGEVESVAFTALIYEAAAAKYEIKISSNAAITVNLNNVEMLAQSLPVWSY